MASWVVRTAQGGRGFSHVGIVERTRDGWTVVHALPAEGARADRGHVVRDPLSLFTAREDADSVAVYRARVADAGRVAAALRTADRMVIDRTPFDTDFDLRTPERVYCTELVLRAFWSAGVDVGAGRRDTVRLLGRSQVVVLPATLARSPTLVRVAASLPIGVAAAAERGR